MDAHLEDREAHFGVVDIVEQHADQVLTTFTRNLLRELGVRALELREELDRRQHDFALLYITSHVSNSHMDTRHESSYQRTDHQHTSIPASSLHTEHQRNSIVYYLQSSDRR